jgi:hypothetical protein
MFNGTNTISHALPVLVGTSGSHCLKPTSLTAVGIRLDCLDVESFGTGQGRFERCLRTLLGPLDRTPRRLVIGARRGSAAGTCTGAISRTVLV